MSAKENNDRSGSVEEVDVHTSYERQKGSMSGFSSISEKSGRSQDMINLKIINFWTKKVNRKNA